MHAVASEVLGEALASFRKYKEMGEGAIEQATDDQLVAALDEEGNSIALIVKHLRGNMLSRWTDFLTTDGEKPDRNRDSEFELEEGVTRDLVMRWWEEGWGQLFATLEALRPTDLERVVTIRGEPHSVLQAILRQVAHYSYHVGQIVFLAKHFRSGEWRSLSIPKKR